MRLSCISHFFFAFVICLPSVVCQAAPSDQRLTILGNMMVYPVGEELKKNKQAIVDACHDLACTDEQLRLALAVAMGESQTACCHQRDASKDGSISANYSCFNMNEDMLQMVGWASGDPDLNKPEGLQHAVSYLIEATHKFGIDGFLHFHRGGRTALQDGKSYGAQEYAGKIKCVMQTLQAEPHLQNDGTRLAFDIPHV